MNTSKISTYKNYIIYIIAIGGAIYFLSFSYSRYFILTKQKQSLRNSITLLQNKTNQDASMYREKQIYEKSILYIKNTLPTNTSLIDWVRQENTMASLAGLKNEITFANANISKNNITIIGNTSKSVPQTLGVAINVQGSFLEILNFIKMMESSYYFTNITSVAISVQTGLNYLNGAISLNLYVQ